MRNPSFSAARSNLDWYGALSVARHIRWGGDEMSPKQKPDLAPNSVNFPALVISIVIVVAALVSAALTSSSWARFGLFIAVVVSTFAVGAFGGFIIASPGAGSGQGGTDAANQKGWASRLGVFGTWATGAAFALAIENRRALIDWFSDTTAGIAGCGGSDSSTCDYVYRYATGAWMLAAAVLGFIVGFMQMATGGRIVISRAEEAAQAAEGAAEVARQAAEGAAEVAQKAEGAAKVAQEAANQAKGSATSASEDRKAMKDRN